MPEFTHEGGGDAALADLVARCIIAFEEGGERAVGDLLADAGEAAAEARQQLDALRAAGLLAPPMPDPDQIGGYRVLQRLGSGAVGSVYLAEQRDGVRRKVAIKVIRPGMDTREVLARFAVERQALAMLDHPNVARVLDAGATDDGRPYLCMEYVPGQPITRYCDERRLGVRERVELLAVVCDAVHAAHQKGILHRDLKPSNILVADRDGRPWPTVIDFGVAKSLGPRLLDVTLVTGRGRLVGTPEYMSPEQAANEVDVDTRTDVHALGVVAYELLGGRLPVASERLRRADEREFLRILREEAPPPLRAALREDDGAQIAVRRGVGAAALARALTGELDWIVHKAIEKDRNRRYGVVAELTADLRRYLAREPVSAGPQRALYRWRKFVRRNGLQVASAALVAVALLGGLGASLSFYVDAAEKAEQSERSLDVALAAVERMVQAGEHDLNVVPRMEKVRRRLLDEALALHQRLSDHTGDADAGVASSRARVLVALSKVHGQLGEYDQALRRAREARALLDDGLLDGSPSPEQLALATSLRFSEANWIALVDGHGPRVEGLLADACAQAERLLATPDVADDHRLLVAIVFGRRGASFESTDAARGERWFARARAIVDPMLDAAEDYAQVSPKVLEVLAHHARFCVEVGADERAVPIAERLAVALDAVWSAADDPVERARHARALEQLGSIWNRVRDHRRGAAAYGQLVALRRALVRDYPGMREHQSGLAIALANLAIAQEGSGRIEQAVEHFEEAGTRFAALADAHPGVSSYRHQAIQLPVNLAQHFVSRTNYGLPFDAERAAAALRRGRAAFDAAVAAEVSDLDEPRAELRRLEGLTAQLAGREADSILPLRDAIAAYEQLLRDQPDRVWLGERVIECHRLLGAGLVALGRKEEAAKVVDDALARRDRMPESFRRWATIVSMGRDLVGLRAQLAADAGRFADCEAELDRYLDAATDPDDWVGHDFAAKTALRALRVATTRGDEAWRDRLAERARGLVTEAVSAGDGLDDVDPVMVAIMRSNSLRIVVDVERACDRPAAAAEAQRVIAAGYRMAFDARPTARNRDRVDAALRLLAELLEQAGLGDEAAACRAEREALPAARR